MSIFDIAAILLSLAALFGFPEPPVLQAPYGGRPHAHGPRVFGPPHPRRPLLSADDGRRQKFVAGIDFNETLMNCMLSYLLFAGALHVNLSDLYRQKFAIGLLATAGILVSTFLVGTGVYFALDLLSGPSVPYIWCLVFGALISPTDPVAVLGVLKQAKAPKSLETKIAGESLFNDGVGVVVFLVLLGVATGNLQADAGSIASLFGIEVFGGLVLGLVVGWIGYSMIKRVDEFQIEVLITLAMVTGGYSLATHLHMSGPLAMVVAGLMIGNHGRSFAMSEKTREHLDSFWILVDEILNAVLFVLIGIRDPRPQPPPRLRDRRLDRYPHRHRGALPRHRIAGDRFAPVPRVQRSGDPRHDLGWYPGRDLRRPRLGASERRRWRDP